MWTKIGDEFSDAARDLSSDAFRTHIEALLWSNRRGLDLVIPKRDLSRFAEAIEREKAVAELVESGWWQDLDDDGWYVGCRFADWQLESCVVDHRRALNAERQRRHRLHKAGDHSLCTENCQVKVTRDSTRDETRDETSDPGRDGTGRVGTGKNQEHVEEKNLGTGVQTREDHRLCSDCGKAASFSLAGRCRTCHFAFSEAS